MNTLAHGRWRRHTDEQIGLIDSEGEPAYVSPSPFNAPRLSNFRTRARKPSTHTADMPGIPIDEQEVVMICRRHFASFENLQVAAAHYGLTDGRLSQIQNGIAVGCPRVLGALGIKRYRGGEYRRVAA